MEATDPFRDPSLYKYTPIPPLKQFKRLFRRLDIYALPITLRYKGEKKFYTNFGALTSLLIVLLMVAYIWTEINLMLSLTQYTSTSTSSTVMLRDYQDGEFSYATLVEQGNYADMTFGISARFWNGTNFYDPSYFTLVLEQESQSYNSFNNNYDTEITTLEFANCLESYLFALDSETGVTPLGMTSETLQQYHVNQYWCPTNFNMKDLVARQQQSTRIIKTSVKVRACDSATSSVPCKNAPTIDEAMG